MTDDEAFELLTLVGRRIRLLERLVEGPVSKRDLPNEVSMSRSTIDRAIKDLEAAGLVAWTDEGYEATLAGRLMAVQYGAFARQAASVGDALPILDVLPPDAPVGPEVLDDCEVVETTGLSRYELPERLLELVDRVAEPILVLPTRLEPEALKPLRDRVATGDLGAEMFVAPELLDLLEGQFRSIAGGIAGGDARVYEAGVPPFAMAYAPEEAKLVVSVRDEDKSTSGLLCNAGPPAARWAEGLVEELRAGAIEVTDELESLARPVNQDRNELLVGDRLRLRTEGFVEPSESYFDRREPAPPATSWRTGLSLAEVAVGLAVDRERPAGLGAGSSSDDVRNGSFPDEVRNGSFPDDVGNGSSNGNEGNARRRSVTDEVRERLLDGRDVAVLGPPGSGKSTVCKTVAFQWYEQGHGPVLYRESGAGEPFESWPLLVEAVRASDGQALIVVEDAVRPEARTVFQALAELEEDDASILVDAREAEWSDPSTGVDDSRLAVRTDAVDTVVVPPLDEREVERFVEQFETETEREVEADPAELLAAVRDVDADRAAPAELQLLGHRLSLRAAPPAADASRAPTTLVEDVRRLHRELETAGEVPLSVGVLANALNAAGIAVRPAYLHAVAPEDPDSVRRARSILEGRVLFGGNGASRTVHESWSTLFLRELLDGASTDDAAADLFGRPVSQLLALADDPDLRVSIARTLGGESPLLDRIADEPGEWADETVERIFGVGRENPGLAPLYGRTGSPSIELPDACADERRVEAILQRANMYLHNGALDCAETEFEALRERVELLDPERAETLHARVALKRGGVYRRRGEYDAAEEYFHESLRRYSDLDDRSGVADCRKQLGNLAWLRGEYEVAERQYRDVLETYREVGDRLRVAYTLHNLANVQDAVGNVEAAEGHYRDALSIYREIGTRRDEADCLNNLGVLAETNGEFGAARKYYREGYQLYRALGDRLGVAHTVTNLGIVENKCGRPTVGEAYAQQGLRGYRKAGDRRGIADARGALGQAARGRGEFDAAEQHLRERLDLVREIDDAVGEAGTHLGLAQLARDRGDLDEATERGTRSLEQYRELGRPRDEAASHVLLGSVARLRGEFDAADQHLRTARDRGREAEDAYREGRSLAGLGELALDLGDPSTARRRFTAAAELFETGDAVGRLADVLDRLAVACERDDDPEAAENARSRAQELATEPEPGIREPRPAGSRDGND